MDLIYKFYLFSYKKASQLKSQGLWGFCFVFFVWFFQKACALWLDCRCHRQAILSALWLCTRKCWSAEGTASLGRCGSWWLPLLSHTLDCAHCVKQTLTLHEHYRRKTKHRQLLVLCGQSTFLSASRRLKCFVVPGDKSRQAVHVQPGALRRGQQAQTVAVSYATAALTLQSAGPPSQKWYFKQTPQRRWTREVNKRRWKEGNKRVCNVPMTKNWSCHLRRRNWATDLAVADIWLKKNSEGNYWDPRISPLKSHKNLSSN